MGIEVGQVIPKGTFTIIGEKGPQVISSEEIFLGKKVVLMAVPGAFTPTCAISHLPGFVAKFDEMINLGVDSVACLAVNDVFVVDAWSKASNAENLLMLADGNADYTKELGLLLDVSGFGMGLRSQRYAMVVEDSKVLYLGVDPEGVDKSSVESVLKFLQ